MPATKISITLDATELAFLRRRAKRVHGGNLSAALSEAARTLRKQEALAAFVDAERLPPLTPRELAAIEDEWRHGRHRRKRKGRAA